MKIKLKRMLSMKKITLLAMLTVVFQLSFAQKFTISGTVKEAKTGEPVIGAKVFDLK